MTCKRLLDILVAGGALLVFWPLLLIVALATWACMGRPLFFRQTRPGLGGKPFVLLKFRTMTEARDAQGELLPDRERLGAWGRFLRRTSLDELPQLWNVLKGEMSLVGPRPLLMEYLQLYSPQQARRHEVRPGITGWAQVNGRNAVTWQERFAMDTWYVDNRSLWLDVKILALTALRAISGRGVEREDGTPMPRFRGSACGKHIDDDVIE